MKTKITSVLLLLVLLLNNSASDPICPLSCENIPEKQILRNLWKLNKNLSSLMIEYQTDLIKLLSTCSEFDGIVMGQSLLAVDKLTGFQPDISANCVYSNLIKQSQMMESGTGNPSNYNQAVLDFQQLALAACDNSVRVGLIAAGCPVGRAQIFVSESCPIDSSVEDYLKNSAKFPETSKNWISKLIKSTNTNERAIGLSAVATLTTPIAKFFSDLYEKNEFVNAVSLKGCNQKIPAECCRIRGFQLRSTMDALKIAVQAETQKILET
ncbi:uncharacterized protein LOC143917096 [Arctopsyche grandis]|uniref:uncharacterized protein LOC143917096 n=1 Tax=Arctopsyche grandis TaxID=121162 RepID=UPI00406D91C1